ncbi:MAG: 1-deoxy-D-xylulose-5-phosphate reductoisomerase [Phycisphaerales bacterium]|nr:1-deoxy-D-xylulose-5-phosphate reductoisomerase [Phycisphaerales bacterium]
MSKRIAILGSTGSIGCNALAVIEHLGAPYQAVALSGNRNTARLVEQIRQHRPSAVAVRDDEAAGAIAPLAGGAVLYRGADGLVEMVQRDDIDIVLAAIVGAAGLPAVMSAIQAKKTIALANKEALVVAGSLVIPEAKKRGVELLPVDSEHSAIFQAMQAGRREDVKRVILTASGGPFRDWPVQRMQQATVDEALAHPTWNMGGKITIDSATMFNKGLELIEACWLFGLPPSKIEIVIHPESVVHSMVEFVDGSVLAQLSPPDMRTPIQYALTWPHRRNGISRMLDLTKAFSLNFEPPNFDKFPALRLAYDVACMGGTAGAVMNAANEIAVSAFLEGNIAFGRISAVVADTISQHQLQEHPSMDDLLEADRWARNQANLIISQ